MMARCGPRVALSRYQGGQANSWGCLWLPSACIHPRRGLGHTVASGGSVGCRSTVLVVRSAMVHKLPPRNALCRYFRRMNGLLYSRNDCCHPIRRYPGPATLGEFGEGCLRLTSLLQI